MHEGGHVGRVNRGGLGLFVGDVDAARLREIRLGNVAGCVDVYGDDGGSRLIQILNSVGLYRVRYDGVAIRRAAIRDREFFFENCRK
jgi:hypothetical protein